MAKTETTEKQKILDCFRSWDHAQLMFCDSADPVTEVINEIRSATGLMLSARTKHMCQNFIRTLHGMDAALVELGATTKDRDKVYTHLHYIVENCVRYEINEMPYRRHWHFRGRYRCTLLKPVYTCSCSKCKYLSRSIKCLHYLNLFLACKGYPKMDTQWYNVD